MQHQRIESSIKFTQQISLSLQPNYLVDNQIILIYNQIVQVCKMEGQFTINFFIVYSQTKKIWTKKIKFRPKLFNLLGNQSNLPNTFVRILFSLQKIFTCNQSRVSDVIGQDTVIGYVGWSITNSF